MSIRKQVASYCLSCPGVQWQADTYNGTLDLAAAQFSTDRTTISQVLQSCGYLPKMTRYGNTEPFLVEWSCHLPDFNK